MGLWSQTRERLRALIFRSREERDLEEELRLHLEMEASKNVEQGMDPEQARQRALVAFGGVEHCKDEVRYARGTQWLDDLMADVAYAARTLRKAPGFASAAALTLALGIGATTTIFSLFDAAYLRALPYPEADRLVALWQDRRGHGGPAEARFNPPDFATVRSASRTLQRVAATTDWAPAITGTSDPERLEGRVVSPGYFALFGAEPVLGRVFTADEETPDGADVVVLSHGLWQRRFGGEPSVVGATLTLDGEPWMVIGVAPAGFQPPGGKADIWRPLRFDSGGGTTRMFRILDVVGRLAPGASVESARADLSTIASGIARAHPGSNAGVAFRLAPLEERVLGPVRPAFLALLGAAALLLLASCANVAGLLIARGAVRAREVAMRAALGAGRGRLIRQLLTEGVLLGVLGGAVGIGFATGGTRLLRALIPAGALPGVEASVDWRIAGIALGLSVAAALLFALLPALRLSGLDLTRALKAGGDGLRWMRRSTRARSGLVVAETALSLVLVVGAGLFFRSFLGLLAVETGFEPEHLLTGELSLPDDRYAGAEDVSRFYNGLLEELRRQPDVLSAGATSFLPLRGGDNDVSFRIAGRDPAKRPEMPNGPSPSAGRRGARGSPGGPAARQQAHAHSRLAWYRIVTLGYFRTMGIRILHGRAFTERDRADAPAVVIVNETLARRHWPDAQDAIGDRISPEWADGRWMTIVGVVEDVRHNGLAQSASAELYHPYAQMPGTGLPMTVVVRGAGNAGRLGPTLRDAVHSLDRDVPLDRVATMEDVVGRSLALPRLYVGAFGGFAGIALLLAAVGLYGVVWTVVAQRTREIGVRMAIGARPAVIISWVLRRTGLLALLGIAIGSLVALAFSRALESLLYGVSPLDPLTFVGAGAAFAGVALLAALLPARRAARVDPLVTLRVE